MFLIKNVGKSILASTVAAATDRVDRSFVSRIGDGFAKYGKLHDSAKDAFFVAPFFPTSSTTKGSTQWQTTQS